MGRILCPCQVSYPAHTFVIKPPQFVTILVISFIWNSNSGRNTFSIYRMIWCTLLHLYNLSFYLFISIQELSSCESFQSQRTKETQTEEDKEAGFDLVWHTASETCIPLVQVVYLYNYSYVATAMSTSTAPWQGRRRFSGENKNVSRSFSVYLFSLFSSCMFAAIVCLSYSCISARCNLCSHALVFLFVCWEIKENKYIVYLFLWLWATCYLARVLVSYRSDC